MAYIKETDIQETTAQTAAQADSASAGVSEGGSGGNGNAGPADREERDAGADAAQSPEDSIEAMKRILAGKEEEVKEKHDRWLRAQADLENFKKRSARETADLLKFGNEQLMKELLAVLDNLERSLNHARTSQNVQSLVEGVELVRKSLLATLERHGLKEIIAHGEKFDPARHEATVRLETADHPEGTVVEEFQKGYLIHDRLLRPSLVAVAALPADAGGKTPADA